MGYHLVKNSCLEHLSSVCRRSPLQLGIFINQSSTATRRASTEVEAIKAHVDVDEGCLMSCEPAWLEGDGAAVNWPFCAVGRDWETTTYQKESARRFIT